MYSLHNLWQQKKRIISILPNFLKQTKFFFEFNDYFEAYRNKVKVIQKYYKYARKNKLYLLEKLYHRECQKLIEQDVKKTKLREKNKSEDEEEIQLPEGFSQVSLADCIRNIKITEKEIILKEYLSLLNQKYQHKYRVYKREIDTFKDEQKRRKEEEFELMVKKEVEMLKIQEEKEKTPNEETILITQAQIVPLLEKKSSEIKIEASKPEKPVFLFQEIVEKVHNNPLNMPMKPVFNVFQYAEKMQERLNRAIEEVKTEKKWIVL